MKTIPLLSALLFFCALRPAPAQEPQMDIEAMMRWGSADVVHYHIVGVFQGRADVIADANWIGYADVSDRVVIDLTWKLSESKLAGKPVFLNEKSSLKNLRNWEPKCQPPVLKGEYEHFELLGIKNGPGGALELQVQTTYPDAEVVQFCSGAHKAVKGRVDKHPQEFTVVSPVTFGMPLPDSDALRISKDKKSLVVKNGGWTWTYTPSIKSGN